MPEIKLKHVVSFSSEDKVHKAENLLKPETYRKWKCATPGEKNASVVLQFEKASKIHSIDIGNECSAFIEVLVGRSSDSLNDFQVLLVASSFMSPLESRNESHTNRVRMFGPEKLSPKCREEKWDCVQIVCTQPFNKNITYGLTFVKFHSPAEKSEVQASDTEATAKIGSFKLKSEDEEEDSLPAIGSWFGKKKENSQSSPNTSFTKDEPSYASSVLASVSSSQPRISLQKRKVDNNSISPEEPPQKKSSTFDKGNIIYKNVLGDITPESKKKTNIVEKEMTDNKVEKEKTNNKVEKEKTNKQENKKVAKSDDAVIPTSKQELKKVSKTPDRKESITKSSTNVKPDKPAKKVPFHQIMKKVVFVLSGFVNPLRSELRDKALEMGAKYKADWDSSCTHLVCAFLNTPKYIQVRSEDGRVVTKDWINDCYKKKTLLPWRSYMLGKYTKDTSGESEDSDDDVDPIIIKDRIKINGKVDKNVTSSPKKKKTDSNILNKPSTPVTPKNITASDDSETEDEDALKDYFADTDVEAESDDSGCDTEEEILKIENKQARKAKESQNKNSLSPSKKSSITEKPDVSNLPLPELPNLFKEKHFFLYGKFSPSKQHDLQRIITAYNGFLEDYMCDKVKYVITEEKWGKAFENALNENEDLIFVKALWIYKCHEAGKLVPYQPYIIIPDSWGKKERNSLK